MSNAEMMTIDLSDDAEFLIGLTARFPDKLMKGNEGAAISWVEGDIQAHRDKLTPGLLAMGSIFLNEQVDAVHVKGLSLPDLPPTPDAYEPVEEASVYSFDIPHIAISSLAGMAFGTRHVRGGRIMADIFPRTGFKQKQDSAFGSAYDFDFHADGVVQADTTPDVFTLHCLRNIEQAPTFFSSVRKEDLSEDAFSSLADPVHTILYEVDNAEDVLRDVPIVAVDNHGSLKLNYYGAAKVRYPSPPEDPNKYSDALQEFQKALDKNVQSVNLQPGEMLFVDNRKLLHGRRAFDSSHLDASDRRWLRRVFIAQNSSLTAKITESKDRILTSQYKK